MHDCILFHITISIIETPQQPQLVMVSPVNSTTVTVSWSEVQCFNGSVAVTHYLVQYHSMCGLAVQNVTTNGLVQAVNVSGLTLNTEYTFQVAAADVNRPGPFSDSIRLGGIWRFYLAVFYHVCITDQPLAITPS